LEFLLSKKQNKTDPKISNCSILNSNNIFKEVYKRVVIPFYILVLTLVSLFLITLSKENSKYARLKIITFSIGIFFIIFSETTIRLISESLIRNILISFLPILFISILYLIFFKKFSYEYFKR
jgi:lipopolysaccharide export system permease protein